MAMNIAMLFTGRAKAVPLIRREQVLHREPAIAQGDHDLIGFGLVHARIVRALDHHQRRFDLFRRS